MKKIILLLLIALLLTGCNGAPQGNPDLQITRATEPGSETTGANNATEATQETADVFYFQAGNVTVVPGTAFDATQISYEDVYEVPSCAGEGTDKVYINADYEITAFHDGKSEITYSVLFITPEAKTAEGLSLGDDAAKAASLYGQYEENGNAWVFTRGNTQLWVISENDVVTSIELRWVY